MLEEYADRWGSCCFYPALRSKTDTFASFGPRKTFFHKQVGSSAYRSGLVSVFQNTVVGIRGVVDFIVQQPFFCCVWATACFLLLGRWWGYTEQLVTRSTQVLWMYGSSRFWSWICFSILILDLGFPSACWFWIWILFFILCTLSTARCLCYT